MEKYPEYMHGSTYFGNSKAITSIMKHTKEVFAIHIEDALYTGILAEKGNVSRYDHADKHFRNGDVCLFLIKLNLHFTLLRLKII